MGGVFFGGYLFCFCVFSPTAESFGVSAQIGSGVVRGDPDLRFHPGSTRVPPSARFPPGFHHILQGLRGGPGFHEGSTNFFEGCGVVRAGLRKVPQQFHKGSTRVPPQFHQGSTRVPGSGVVRVV